MSQDAKATESSSDDVAIQIMLLNLIVTLMLASVIVQSDSDAFLKTVSNAIDLHIDRLGVSTVFAEKARVAKDAILSNAMTIAAMARQ
jgi:hypothetical protein